MFRWSSCQPARLARRTVVLAAVATVGVALAPTAQAAPGDGFITGTVRSADGHVLQAAVVAAVFYVPDFQHPHDEVVAQAVTDVHGRYRIRVPQTPDTLSVQVTPARAVGGTSPTGYADQCYTGSYVCATSARTQFSNLAGRTVSGIDVEVPAAAEIRGRLVDSAGRSVSGYPVYLKTNGICGADDQADVGSAKTDANGNYVFLRRPAYTVRACLGIGSLPTGRPYVDGYVGRFVDIRTTSGRISSPVTTMREAGAISGRVVDGSGAPVPGATVSAGTDDVFQKSQDTTAANGSFRVGHLPVGSVGWCVEAPRFEDSCDDAQVRSGRTTGVGTVVLRRVS